MTDSPAQSKYRVDLPIFRGPLDLLLYLVKKHEVDILDIPIATVTESFLRYLELLQLIDIEAVGDFIVLASTLMEIKSRMLLPMHDEPGDESANQDNKLDPRAELVKQLVAYRRFREATRELDLLTTKQASSWPRGSRERPYAQLDPSQQPVQAIELWDLVSAFDRLLRDTLSHQQQAIETDETPQHVYMSRVLDLLQAVGEPVFFENLFQPPHTKSRLIGVFLALLELIKLQKVYVEQSAPFSQIVVRLLTSNSLAA